MRCRAVLGLRPTALPASTPRVVSFVSVSLLSVRAPVRYGPFASSAPLLRQERWSADGQFPTPRTCQDVTDVTLKPLLVIVYRTHLFLYPIKVNLIWFKATQA